MKIKLFTVPNALTLMNLLCGSFATVVVLTTGSLTFAFLLIVLAALFDFFDGFTARLMQRFSPIGGDLDSLADMVSFGLAPAAVLFVIDGNSPSLFSWWLPELDFLVFIMTAFAALRLAKFNVDDTQHSEFSGLPVPAAALYCASLGWLVQTGELTLHREVVLITAIIVSALMVSNIRMFALKFKGFGWKGNELRYSFLLVSAVLLILLWIRAVPLIILLYVIVSICRSVCVDIK